MSFHDSPHTPRAAACCVTTKCSLINWRALITQRCGSGKRQHAGSVERRFKRKNCVLSTRVSDVVHPCSPCYSTCFIAAPSTAAAFTLLLLSPLLPLLLPSYSFSAATSTYTTVLPLSLNYLLTLSAAAPPPPAALPASSAAFHVPLTRQAVAIDLACVVLYFMVHPHPPAAPSHSHSHSVPCHIPCQLATSSTTSFFSVSGQCEMHMQIYNNFTFSHALLALPWLVNRLLRRKVRTAIEGLATIFDLPAKRCVCGNVLFPPLSLPFLQCGKCLCIKNRLWLCSAQIEQSINPNLLTV